MERQILKCKHCWKKNLPFFSRGRPRNEKNQREVVEKNGDAKY
jgi:hypothetical protein